MTTTPDDLLEQIDRHFEHGNQAWLLGAGISVDAGLPLMWPLTARVCDMAKDKPHEALMKALLGELPETAHIEHVLSQLGDYAAIAKRMKDSKVNVSGSSYTLDDLQAAHAGIAQDVASTIRWGYIPGNDKEGVAATIGAPDNPLATVDGHADFVRVLFEKRQAGLWERRKPVYFFTTNYDTLLEDALALGRYSSWDGFSGGAIAFRDHVYGKAARVEGMRAVVVKLHGSIDWVLGKDGEVWRVRETDKYPPRYGRVLIHPQSTKYVSTQKDPFAAQFDLFRRILNSSDELVFAIVGYSFGDDHVNEEIERALSSKDNKTTLIAFCRENNSLPPALDGWRNSSWGDRVFVLTEKSIYWGSQGPFHQRKEGEHNWWSFKGMTGFIENRGE
ncbi:SIR2-like domain-containing protein [Lysobacter sp. cf310]|nr:SIR2-like domain-containing protein [Lysobacter sp. cf310]